MSPTTLDIPAGAAPLGLATAATDTTRVYRGRTVEELLPKIQADLGADAVVVRREKGLTGGFAGFFQRPFVEIEARRGTPAIDCYDNDDGAPELPDVAPPAVNAMNGNVAPAQFHELIPAVVNDSVPFAAALAEAETAVSPADDGASLDAPRATPEPTETTELQTLHLTPAAAAPPSGRNRAAIERTLLKAGMDAQLTRELIEAAAAHALALMGGRPSLARAVHTTLAQRIPSCPPLPGGNATIAVVGPGGAGKSALCAALLGAYRKRSTLPASAMTLAHEPNRAAMATVRAAREQSVLVLDTPACSPADTAAIGALAAQLRELAPDRVIVALPATLGAAAARQLLRALAPLGANALAITHVDETDQLGVAVSAACTAGLGPIHLLGRLERARAHGGLTATDPADLAERLLPVR